MIRDFPMLAGRPLVVNTGQVMQEDLMARGIEMMLFGMGTVVLFLTLLVVATNVMSWCVHRFFPEPEPLAPAGGRSPAQSRAQAQDAQLIAAITAAIRQHRKRKP